MSYHNSAYDDYSQENQGEYQPARAGWKQTQNYPNGQQDSYQPPPPRGASLNNPTTQNSNNNNMNGYGGGYQQNPNLGATFYPGGGDDFYMPPNVVSPMPQRIMPEVPNNMQDNLANLELNDGYRQGTSESSRSSHSNRNSGPGYTANYEHTNAAIYQNLKGPYGTPRSQPDSPRFSPFPKPRNAGQNVPLSDEDKEEVLERARPMVLKSTDPEMQLAWAQDALSWVEVASSTYERKVDDSRAPTPKVEHQLRVDAISIVNFLAEQQHPKAEFMKAMWLEFGKFGYRMDKKESFQGYQRAAQKGYARAEYRIGMQFENTMNPAKAVEHYQRGVYMKDSAASYRLGMATLLGQCGMQQDYARGIDLIQFAADTADENAPQGAYVYGMLLARELPNIIMPDEYLPYDLNEAKMFVEKAAYLGFAKAQLKMAQAYELCLFGCEFDPALSLHYNALAARQGEPEADMAISKWFLCGYEGIFEKNEELAYTYAQRAAETEMATAEFAMGYFYEIGMYVKKNLEIASQWYDKAAKHGNQDALGRIDSIRANHTLSKGDHGAAIQRIKSTHGSRRGGRPERFNQANAPPMPSMSEDASSPLPPAHSQKPKVKKGAPAGIRPISIAPYPEDDFGSGNRGSAKISPGYPRYLPQDGLRQSISSSNPVADRPSSAFGVRPQQQPPPPHLGITHQNTEPIRSSSPMGTMPSQGRNPSPSPSRAPNIPPLSFESGYQNPQQRPTTSNSRPGTAQSVQSVQSFQSAQSTYGSRPGPGQNVAPPRNASMTPVSAASSTASRTPNRAMGNTMSSQGGDSRQSSISSASTPAPAAAPAKPSAPAKKGPATFEEMGIPQTKSEGDCVVM
ncbi:b2b34b19-4aae-4250-9956-bc4f03d28002 [Sclerotinia trifoliorum]|uniref:B2b34b19-4aae-4250-9956-bc4f03d28002 n=1 Tax=Sclerotinia trifoliorum TaxID=28548 RepID=A0A8H2W490_9HELO|nr:b2b34b19-4aae-4250-9956-bc4f03d28002 [Sclerotinia trifoliorum]